MTIREHIEQQELQSLTPAATFALHSKGRVIDEPSCDMRTCFMRDTDRITHSKAFRRLAHKTQVFLKPEGDHYRTRLTHTLEVMRIARTMAVGLRLNQDLTEAMALGHDLGHTPFGHAGEAALNELMSDGFTHNAQSLRVVERLERGGRGLNLTVETKNGLLHHTGVTAPDTLEGQLIRYADRIAYINHDFDDAVRAGLLQEADVPAWIRDTLGLSPRERINTLVTDLVLTSLHTDTVVQTEARHTAMLALRSFMFEQVYTNPLAKAEERKGRDLLATLFAYFVSHKDDLPSDYREIAEKEGCQRAVADYLAGMTDRFAVMKYSELTIPKGWEKH